MHTKVWPLVASVAVVLQSSALAQTGPQPGLNVGVGDRVRIVFIDGGPVEGTAGALRPGGLELETADGVLMLSLERIETVERRDSVRNGLLVGAGIGLTVGIVPLVYGNECRYESCAGTQLGLPLAGAAIGGAIGWAVDRTIGGWTTVFDRASDPPRVSLLVGGGGLAMFGAITW